VATAIQERFDDLARSLATGRVSRRQVLKSVAAGLLVSGPLGALWSRFASAQTAGCVQDSCVDSAQQAYATCRRPCKRLSSSRKRKRCLRTCDGTYADQLMGCGCATVDLGFPTPRYAPCEDPCALRTVYGQAEDDPGYIKLVDHLTSDGFTADGGPELAVIRRDGTPERMLLSNTYSDPARTSEVAELYYDVEITGETVAFAAVWDKQQATLLHLLAIHDDNGSVQEVFPSSETLSVDQQGVSMSGTVSSDPNLRTCNNAKLDTCRSDADSDMLLELGECGFACLLGGPALGPALCKACVAFQAGKWINKKRICSRDHGCGLFSTTFCSNNVCCGAWETGCGGNSCCSSCQTCVNEKCTPKCTTPPLTNCVGGTCTCPEGTEDPCGNICCPSGQKCCGGTTCCDANQECCGTICCGSETCNPTDPNSCGACQECTEVTDPIAGTTHKCLVCSGDKVCCNDKCVTPCPQGQILNINCECVCPQATPATCDFGDLVWCCPKDKPVCCRGTGSFANVTGPQGEPAGCAPSTIVCGPIVRCPSDHKCCPCSPPDGSFTAHICCPPGTTCTCSSEVFDCL
jgi:hypothetical protein